MSNLVIVESGAKTKIIKKYLGDDYDVIASFGHIYELDSKSLSIDIKNDFKPKYSVLSAKNALVKNIRIKSKISKRVFIATDNDREGEAIAQHLTDFIKCGNIKRVVFSEITPDAIKRAFANPRKGGIDKHIVSAQETRRVLDRLVGYKISPLLWRHFTGMKGLSAGRVQSAALAMIVKKEEDIAAMREQCHWNISGEFMIDDVPVKASFTVDTEREALDILNKLTFDFTLKSLEKTKKRISPPKPLNTSTLQQMAFLKLGMSAVTTMKLAQELYERGKITYMRTDATKMSSSFVEKCEQYITQKYGKDYVNPKNEKYAMPSGAHEAIRPTHLDEKEDCGPLYRLILEHTVQSLMSDCITEVATYLIKCIGKHCFTGTLSRILFDGFRYPGKTQQSFPKGAVITADKVDATQVWSEAPSRYNEATFVKKLEKEGIGRPSTYASIVSKLLMRQYVKVGHIKGVEKAFKVYSKKKGRDVKLKTHKKTVGNEKNVIIPTGNGTEVNTYMIKQFPYIADKTFTAKMETDLDLIESGDKTKMDVLNAFWKKFEKDISTPQNSTMVRNGKYGPFIEWSDDQNVKHFIGLEAYMNLTGKGSADITEHDVEFLKSFPKTLDDGVEIHYGRYGFYKKFPSGKTQSIKEIPV